MHVRHGLASVGPRVEHNPVPAPEIPSALATSARLAGQLGEQAPSSAAASAARSG